MSIDPAAAFSLTDLGVFDEAYVHELIASVPGAVSPELAGCALANDGLVERQQLAEVATHIEQALSPTDRAAFVRSCHCAVTTGTQEAAQRAILDQLFWDLTYWKTPDEYERLTVGEQVHLGALDFAHVDGAIVLDAGAGTGRLTLPLARRARTVYAMDPALPLLHLLQSKLAAAHVDNVDLLRGVFRHVPLPDNSVDAVVSCSAFGTAEARGGQCGLDEFRRVTRPGGRIVIMWPEDPAWLIGHGFHYTSLPGHLTITFPTLEDAWKVATRFYGGPATRWLEATCRPELPFSVLGVKAPRDLCWLAVRK